MSAEHQHIAHLSQQLAIERRRNESILAFCRILSQSIAELEQMTIVGACAAIQEGLRARRWTPHRPARGSERG